MSNNVYPTRYNEYSMQKMLYHYFCPELSGETWNIQSYATYFMYMYLNLHDFRDAEKIWVRHYKILHNVTIYETTNYDCSQLQVVYKLFKRYFFPIN